MYITLASGEAVGVGVLVGVLVGVFHQRANPMPSNKWKNIENLVTNRKLKMIEPSKKFLAQIIEDGRRYDAECVQSLVQVYFLIFDEITGLL